MPGRKLSDEDKRIGLHLAKLRKKAGLSQQALGKAVGLSYQQVQKQERGTNRLSVSAMLRMAPILGVTPEEFVRGIDAATPSERVQEVLIQAAAAMA